MLEYDTETKKIIIVNYLITKPKVVKQRKIGPRNEFEVLEKTHGFWNDLSRRRQENQILFERKA
jgi:hypothetical protein